MMAPLFSSSIHRDRLFAIVYWKWKSSCSQPDGVVGADCVVTCPCEGFAMVQKLFDILVVEEMEEVTSYKHLSQVTK